jgi:NAD(P)-dependent dehydrogenase (short-subunit alcohol dehydrogenase family)
VESFAEKIAVVTGGGSGIGRELVRHLVAQGCHVAMCDVSVDAMIETRRLCEDRAPGGPLVTVHRADVSDEAQLLHFRDEIIELHATDKIHLLFNNAGISGGGSLFSNSREEWDRTFALCWGGVYLGTRTFLPLLRNASESHLINVSSCAGFWASVGPHVPHTAYCAAKFAVKGFTEALITDLRLHAPHVKCSVVMPGHTGTSIVSNTRKIQSGTGSDRLSKDELVAWRLRMTAQGTDTSNLADEDVQNIAVEQERKFRLEAPTTAAEAARIILDGVKRERWRILVGDGAHRLDELVRKTPDSAYDDEFFYNLTAEVGWRLN